jgi:hypothetical protein
MLHRDEFEISALVTEVRKNGDDNLLRYADFLMDWVRTVNTYTDGWHSWKAGSEAGRRIADLLARALKPGSTVKDADFNRVVAQIKRLAKTQVEKYGNLCPVPHLREKGELPEGICPKTRGEHVADWSSLTTRGEGNVVDVNC